SNSDVEKGSVLAVARVAGIMAAKRTAELIPLCHPLPLNHISIDFEPDPADHRIDITATCRTAAQTGVEMEALTAATIAALTIYDMCKAIDRSITIGSIRLIEKTGGRSGSFAAPAEPKPGR
ncbi:MAG: cyclic pyranopterin monophosphate synthase MoaC, partial [Rhodospirillales bacterium]|nr:cyclic pyranopterin monophosphate synthase MoaC [Rhodospirillales bacterium]